MLSLFKEAWLLPIVRLAARVAVWAGYEREMGEIAGPDYLALAWYWRIDRDRACELMELWYPEAY